LGYGALMGLLKNYEVINPFISCTTDAFNRLKPGFEAPVCIVTSLGLAPDIPSRNRTVLIGLVRDLDNTMATRFEMRSPNPYTNTYIAIATFYLAALDGIKAVLASGKGLKELEKEISKKSGDKGFYLEQNRQYRTEADVFESFTETQRNKLFSKPPATVWENLLALKNNPAKVKVLTAGNILQEKYIMSFREAALIRWQTELVMQYIPEFVDKIKKMACLKNVNSTDKVMWTKIEKLRNGLAKDGVKKCVFTQIKDAFAKKDYNKASKLQIEMQEAMLQLTNLYHDYKQNIID
ncbi:MAG: glutamine synthetase, partial [Acidaminococcaceae bacterium]|nr:glutamine synthetase [Acidaminococcaceae bacterium]